MQRTLVALAGMGLLALTSCDSGPAFYSIKGNVTYGAAPIESGLIRFESTDGKSPSNKGGIIVNGAYTAEVPAGEMTVRITARKVVGKKKMYPTDDSPVVDDVEQFLPTRYNADSTLSATISGHKEDLDFALAK